MKKLILVICFILFGAVSVNAAVPKVSGEQAEFVVQSAADEAFNFLKSQKESGWNQEEVEVKMSEVLNDYFNVDYIAKASIARYWKRISKEEKDAYLKVFRENIIKVYAVRFKEYSDQIINVEKSSVRGRGDVIVFSKITSKHSDQPPLDVDWRVRQQRDGSYKIIDLNIAGISMLVTQKNEYQAIIEKNGGSITALINELKDIIANN